MWLEPELKAEISYAEVMQGRLRALVFCRVLGRFSPFLGDPTARRQTGAVIKVAPSVGHAGATLVLLIVSSFTGP